MEEYSFQAQLTRITPIGLLSDGLRIDVSFAGALASGPLSGGSIEGTDYLVIRPDGVAVIDAREVMASSDGVAAEAHATGYVVPPFEMPELSVVAQPSFAWPDVDLPLHGSARIRSAHPVLAAANRFVYSFTGAVNLARGSLTVSARRIAADGAADGQHPSASLLANGYRAFAARDIPAVLGVFAHDIGWRVPGDNPVSGSYKGHEEVVGFFSQLMGRSGGTFSLDVHDIVVGDGRVVALVTEHAGAGAAILASPAAHIWRLADGKLTEFTEYHEDQAAVDAFWRQTG